MAKIVESFPNTYTHAQYPWDELLDGQVWLLTQGEDFPATTSPEHFRRNCYVVGKKRGLRVRSRIVDNTVTIQAY